MAVPPQILWSEFAVSGVSPSGARHLTTHPSYVGALGTGPGEYLNYGLVNNSKSKQTTGTKVVVPRVGLFNDANEAIFNMRFWVGDISDWTDGTFRFNGFPSGEWIQDLAINDNSGVYVPTELPSGQNIWRANDGVFDRNSDNFKQITASGVDNQVLMYQYLSVTLETNVPPKVYGGDGGGFAYRLTFDYK